MSAGSSVMLLSEVIGALSYALDLTEGEPPGHATRSCVIGMRLAEELELNAATRSDLFYALLLKDAGCTANAARMAALFGADDHELKHSAKRSDWSAQFSAFIWSVAQRGSRPGDARPARSPARDQGRGRGDALADGRRAASAARRSPCMVGLSERTADAIRTLDEHWDGHGQPRGLDGRRDPAARPHPVPRPDRRDLPRGGRDRGRLRRRRAPQRPLVRPRARGRARRLPRRRRLLGLARRARPGPLGAARPGADRRRRRASSRSRPRSPRSSTPSRRGPTTTRTARA